MYIIAQLQTPTKLKGEIDKLMYIVGVFNIKLL